MADTTTKAYRMAIIKFAGQDRAKQIVDLVKKNEKKLNVEVKSWAVVEVNDKGKMDVKQQGHGGWGTAVGGGTGVLLGLIGGPAGLLVWALGGALLGGLAGKYLGHQFDEDELKAVAAAMEPNTSALILVVEDELAEQVAEELGIEDGQLLTIALGDQISGELETVTVVDLGEAGAADAADADHIDDSAAAE